MVNVTLAWMMPTDQHSSSQSPSTSTESSRGSRLFWQQSWREGSFSSFVMLLVSYLSLLLACCLPAAPKAPAPRAALCTRHIRMTGIRNIHDIFWELLFNPSCFPDTSGMNDGLKMGMSHGRMHRYVLVNWTSKAWCGSMDVARLKLGFWFKGFACIVMTLSLQHYRFSYSNAVSLRLMQVRNHPSEWNTCLQEEFSVQWGSVQIYRAMAVLHQCCLWKSGRAT